MDSNDRKIIRDLAGQYYNVAISDENSEKVLLYKSVNDLKMIRPVVLIDEIPWHEMNFNGELDLKCTDGGMRGLEHFFRYELFRHKYLDTDRYLPPYFAVGKRVNQTGIGIGIEERTIATDPKNYIVSHEYVDKLQTEEDIAKLQNQTISYDKEATEKHFEYVSEIIGDIIPVKITAHDVGMGLTTWDIVSMLKGVTNLLTDLVERPEFMHKIARRLADIFMDKIRQFEALNLLAVNHPYLHCAPAFTNDLEPVADYDNIKLKNVWGRGVAQIFGAVSKEMHDEFDIQYMVEALEPFGMVYYGCCEPLDTKIDILSKIKNLRKISITPWANVNVAAEAIGKNYVMAVKPNPANVGIGFDEDTVRKELDEIVDAARRNNCSFDLVLKDISTVAGKPEHLIKWAKIAMDVARNY